MRRSQPLGLDKLMIVNPGPSDSGALFLGEDGTLYQVQGHEEWRREAGQFFLGEDGTLYQAQGQGLRSPPERTESAGKDVGEHPCCQSARFFLGEDGTVYEAIR
jgi:hypothetical protein